MPRSLLFLLILAFAGTPFAQALPERSFLLVAKRGLVDPFFGESVVLVTRRAGSAPVGVILNKPLDFELSQVFPEAKPAPAGKLLFGGPVRREGLVVVFRADNPHEKATEVLAGLHMSSSVDLMKEMLAREKRPELRVYTGHSAWAPGQLEAELERGSWHIVPADARHVFTANPKRLWRQLEARASATTVQGPAIERMSSSGAYSLPSFTTR